MELRTFVTRLPDKPKPPKPITERNEMKAAILLDINGHEDKTSLIIKDEVSGKNSHFCNKLSDLIEAIQEYSFF
jgi:hypothetical protein